MQKIVVPARFSHDGPVERPFDSWSALADIFARHNAEAYAVICRACAADPEWSGHDSPLTALHTVRLASFSGRATDPFTGDADAFLRDLDALQDEVLAAAQRGLVQFTEPLRVADILPGLLLAARWAQGRPLRLVEIGCSVGFLLVPDRFRIQYPTGSWTPADAVCDLSSDLHVPPAILDQSLVIQQRLGVDLAPVDANAPGALDHLRAFTWPGDPAREQRLAAAMPTVRVDPPPVVCADAITALPDLITNTRDAVTVVIESALSGYLAGREAMRLSRTLDRLALRTDLMLLSRGTSEDPHLTSSVTLVDLTRRRRIRYALTDMVSERTRWVGPAAMSGPGLPG